MISDVISKIVNCIAPLTTVLLAFIAPQVLLGSASAQSTEKVLLNFAGPGAQGGLIWDGQGNLYGTTEGSRRQFGTVFELRHLKSGRWSYKLLYRFAGGNDGAYPQAGLVFDSSGNLYGAAAGGGANVCSYSDITNTCGVIFQLTPTPKGKWSEKVVYNFGAGGGVTGTNPCTGLTADNSGNLFGATAFGGYPVSGTFFELTPRADGTWAEQQLYAFNGSTPFLSASGPLTLDSKGNVYGSIAGGGNGINCTNGSTGCGMIVQLSPSPTVPWTLTTLYSFCSLPGCGDGGFPVGGVIFDDMGNLYGTTSSGTVQFSGNGTVFELSPGPKDTWSFNLLHTFCSLQGCADGTKPLGGLVRSLTGDLYGTTSFGGAPNSFGGTVFEFSPGPGGTWSFQSLFSSFCATCGFEPSGNLTLDMAGNIYGTTPVGGKADGVLYQITP